MPKRSVLLVLSLAVGLVIPFSQCHAAGYKNKRFGFAIDGPPEWRIAVRDDILETGGGFASGVLVRFKQSSKYRSAGLCVRLDPLKADESASKALAVMKSRIEKKQSKKGRYFKLVEEPREVFLGEVASATCIHETTAQDGTVSRALLYFIHKDNVLIQIEGVAKKEEFDACLQDFNYSVNSIKLSQGQN